MASEDTIQREAEEGNADRQRVKPDDGWTPSTTLRRLDPLTDTL